jgi:hypothetical protein
LIEEASKMTEETGVEAAAAGEREEPTFHLPSPSLWPAALALGVTLCFFGVLTYWAFSVAGAVLAIVAIARWIVELRRDARGEPARHDAHP